MQRLWAGMEALAFACPAHFTPEFLFSEIQNLVKNNGHLLGARVRLQLGATAGEWGCKEPHKPFCFIESETIKSLTFNELGLNVGISNNHRVAGVGPYSAYKKGSALNYFGAAQEANFRALDDVLLLTANDCVGESSKANVFWEEGRQLYTPPLSEGIVSGVARAQLFQVLSQDDFPLAEALLTPERLQSANSLYLTNAVQGIRWVASCEGQHFTAGRSAILFDRLFGA